MSIYSDVNEFSPQTAPLLYDINSVYQALFNLFSTRPLERLFLPQYGFDIDSELFDLINDITSLEIYRLVVDAVTRWEARVLIDNSRTTITPDPDNNAYNLVLAFAIQGVTGQTFQFISSFSS